MFFGIDFIELAVIFVSIALVLFIGQKVHYWHRRAINIPHELTENDNPAVGLAVIGYLFGLLLSIAGLVQGPSNGYLEDAIDIFLYGLLAIVLINIATIITDKLLLYKFQLDKELVTDRNIGTGAVQFGVYIASGLVLKGALNGEGGIDTAIAFWFAGQAALIVLFKIYNILTPFDIHEHLEKDNAGVGICLAGILIATGNIVRLGIMGDFEGWATNFSRFALYTGICALLLPMTRVLIDRVFIPGGKLTYEIVHQKDSNLALALFEATSYVGVSMLLGGMFA
ncbi:MAG: DUF350 domain-containing protein [Pseudobacteriovorax sp.]|nr:DUF350 domain-containing protein [Pseudobacteriovorax sp.]